METSTPSSHPLRPYFVAPSPEAAFGNAPSTPSASTANGPQPSLRFPSSSSAASSSSYDGLSDPPLIAGTVLRAFVTSSLLSFTSTALVMPFEVGKTLAQVQWVPRDGLEIPAWIANEGEVEDEVIELEDENEVDAYFSDVQSRGHSSFAPPISDLPLRATSPSSGYVRRGGVNDEATKPDWVMPVVVQGGVWDMMRCVGRWKGEGWSSLWKGQLTTWLLDATSASVQPLLLTSLSLVILPTSSSPFSSFSTSLPLIHSAHPTPLLLATTLSHALTTFIFSPFDMIRTRLIVQSAQPQHRKYSGPVDAFRTILREEGGLWSLYFHPNLLFPALTEGILRPLIHLSTPLIISRVLHIEPSTAPITYALAEFILGSAGLLLTIPLETVRKRLQIQSRAEFVRAGKPNGTGRAWRTCVETRPAPYAGIVECVYRVLTEETGRIPRRRRRSGATRDREREKEEEREDLGIIGLGVGNGLRQLYRGLGMGIGANAIVFLLGLVAGSDEAAGWAEV